MRSVKSSYFVLLFQGCCGYFRSLALPCKFFDLLVNFWKKLCWNFGQDCSHCIDQFWYNWHLSNIETYNSWTCISLLFKSCLISLSTVCSFQCTSLSYLLSNFLSISYFYTIIVLFQFLTVQCQYIEIKLISVYWTCILQSC